MIEEVRLDGVPVIFTSLPAGERVHARLAAGLLAGRPGDGPTPSAGRAGFSGLVVAHDRWGRPSLTDPRTGAGEAIGISFSHGPQRVWAALACGRRVGIDAAPEMDFEPPYPYRRVFSDLEMERVRPLNGDRQPSAAAQLWAIKEAAVKALGRGFHAFDYREVEVLARVPGDGGLLFAVSAGNSVLTAWTRRERSAWLALAVAGARAASDT